MAEQLRYLLPFKIMKAMGDANEAMTTYAIAQRTGTYHVVVDAMVTLEKTGCVTKRRYGTAFKYTLTLAGLKHYDYLCWAEKQHGMRINGNEEAKPSN